MENYSQNTKNFEDFYEDPMKKTIIYHVLMWLMVLCLATLIIWRCLPEEEMITFANAEEVGQTITPSNGTLESINPGQYTWDTENPEYGYIDFPLNSEDPNSIKQLFLCKGNPMTGTSTATLPKGFYNFQISFYTNTAASLSFYSVTCEIRIYEGNTYNDFSMSQINFMMKNVGFCQSGMVSLAEDQFIVLNLNFGSLKYSNSYMRFSYMAAYTLVGGGVLLDQTAAWEQGYQNGYQEGLENGNTDGSYEEGYNTGFTAGRKEGYDAGWLNGYDVGNNHGKGAGYTQGHKAGYQEGYQQGLEEGDTNGSYDEGYQEGLTAGAGLAQYGIWQDAIINGTFEYEREEALTEFTIEEENLKPDYLYGGICFDSIAKKYEYIEEENDIARLRYATIFINLKNPIIYNPSQNPIYVSGTNLVNITMIDEKGKLYDMEVITEGDEKIIKFSDKSIQEAKNIVTIKFWVGRAADLLYEVCLISKDNAYYGGYTEGYNVGNEIGYSEGKRVGNEEGYERGYEKGVNASIAEASGMQHITSMLVSVMKVFEVKIFGWFSIGDIVGIALIFGIVFFALKLIRG